MADSTEVAAVDAMVQRVAARLPFTVELDADMGGSFVLQIDLGLRGGTDDPHDSAGIDPEPNSQWWVDIEGGTRTHISDLRIDADPDTVAAWIAQIARAENCPAAVSAGESAAAVARVAAGVSYPPTSISRAGSPAASSRLDGRPGRERDRGYGV